jgi:hypothetical protein
MLHDARRAASFREHAVHRKGRIAMSTLETLVVVAAVYAVLFASNRFARA